MDGVTIRLRDHGPLVVEGPCRIIDADGAEYVISSEKKAVALCRCGQSKRRPFCDGTHKECGWSAVDRVVPPAP
jgi:CDGSH-type Zn-finger protein